MFDFRQKSVYLFSQIDSYYESISEVTAEFSSHITSLPSFNPIDKFIQDFPVRDKVCITLKTFKYFTFDSSISNNKAEYMSFLDSIAPESEQDDNDIKITIHISKNYSSSCDVLSACNMISVYSYCDFIQFLEDLTVKKLMTLFANIFKDYNQVYFQILDQIKSLQTPSIIFGTELPSLSHNEIDHSHLLKSARNVSLFLNWIDIPLLPNDFRVESANASDSLVEKFHILETTLSYIYLANSSYIQGNNYVLQFLPSAISFSLDLENTPVNATACDLFQWGFSTDNAAERFGIIRNVLDLRCKNQTDLLNIDDNTFASVKSSYAIFQKRFVSEYVDMKHQIADSIVAASKQLQEISSDLFDAIKNNIIAFFMFFITILLTDSVNWEDLISGDIFTYDLIRVIRIFIICSAVYLILTIGMAMYKWRTFYRSYRYLKNNYKELLEHDDLQKAFNNDENIQFLKCQLITQCTIVFIIWAGILMVISFSVPKI